MASHGYYTQREITLPSLDTADIEPRGPPDTLAYYARDASSFWLDLCLQKVVICEVPTPSEDYMDYKLIALFNMGLVYLESGRHTWLWLIVDPLTTKKIHIRDILGRTKIISVIHMTLL